MDENHLPDDEAQRELLRRCWYSHDARWYAAVAEEFGMEAANRLNRRAVQALGRVEVRRLIRALGLEEVADLEEFVAVARAGHRILVPPPDMEMEFRMVDARSYEVRLGRCYVHENVERAGIAEHYVCAVFDRLAGWHDAVGLPLAEELPALPCAKSRGDQCRRTLTIR